ncbi:MAG: ribonuclease H-like domain-containing protein [Candidatus Xenobium sp.]|nr:hypothetical protein [Burkholderiales bacterium]
MDLRQRLARLDQVGSLKTARPRRAFQSLETLLGGEEVEGERGHFLLCRRHFPRDHYHGKVRLDQALALSARWLSRLGRDLEEMDLPRVVFLDTETTGLSGGTGTYAFLVGLAWFEPDGLCLEQLFMREYAEESALLAYLADRLRGCGGLVTFNGKGFDIPLLATRFLMKRQSFDLEALPHLDLLHPARRIWSLALPDCRLETLETRVLEAPRAGDIPGREIPEAYFRYLKTGDGREMARVAEHNQCDLLALIGLVSRLARTLQAPLEARRPEEDLGLGRMLAGLGETEDAGRLLTRALEAPLPVGPRFRALLHLADMCRRAGDRQGAQAFLEQILDEDPAHVVAAEEMAKHLEHRVGDLPRALALVDGVLERPDLTPARRAALEHRRQRLLRRLEGGRKVHPDFGRRP